MERLLRKRGYEVLSVTSGRGRGPALEDRAAPPHSHGRGDARHQRVPGDARDQLDETQLLAEIQVLTEAVGSRH